MADKYKISLLILILSKKPISFIAECALECEVVFCRPRNYFYLESHRTRLYVRCTSAWLARDEIADKIRSRERKNNGGCSVRWQSRAGGGGGGGVMRPDNAAHPPLLDIISPLPRAAKLLHYIPRQAARSNQGGKIGEAGRFGLKLKYSNEIMATSQNMAPGLSLSAARLRSNSPRTWNMTQVEVNPRS